jgi:hypothetical protein
MLHSDTVSVHGQYAKFSLLEISTIVASVWKESLGHRVRDHVLIVVMGRRGLHKFVSFSFNASMLLWLMVKAGMGFESNE